MEVKEQAVGDVSLEFTGDVKAVGIKLDAATHRWCPP